MNYHSREIENLFKKLGLNDDPNYIENFIEKNKIDSIETHLADAPCWNKSQSIFLRNKIYSDSQWSEAIDQLDIILRN
ncbi:DUF2789 family protein [Neptuniibacter sp. QD48_11]|uniref:DUF2789 family protein n=1 Tax=unclassified Neptuniibacter TaxID=2630693 RepID=UPI0039F4CA93